MESPRVKHGQLKVYFALPYLVMVYCDVARAIDVCELQEYSSLFERPKPKRATTPDAALPSYLKPTVSSNVKRATPQQTNQIKPRKRSKTPSLGKENLLRPLSAVQPSISATSLRPTDRACQQIVSIETTNSQQPQDQLEGTLVKRSKDMKLRHEWSSPILAHAPCEIDRYEKDLSDFKKLIALDMAQFTSAKNLHEIC